jgi:glycyl-tRNA synthetase
MEEIVSLAKRRGFVYPSSEIYGGLANVYDYGPLGAQLLKNIRDLWWKKFITSRADILGLESAIFMHPQVWVASGHAAGFSDPMTEDKVTHIRYRADHLIEDWLKVQKKPNIDLDSMSTDQLNEFIKQNNIKSPSGNELTPIKQFNLMFETQLGSTEDNTSKLYLRAETAQGMYVDFKNIQDSMHKKLPFGVAQQGRVFRNEITTGKFLFRMLEFQQMEIQYFFDGENWEEAFETWRAELESWYHDELGIDKAKLGWKPHSKLIFYAKAAEDVTYEFPWGPDEVSGLHYRTDYDLKTHMEHSGQKMEYVYPDGKKIIPHVLETTWGLDRNFFMLLADSYAVEDGRTILKLPTHLAPYKAAVFPLLANKPDLVSKADQVYQNLIQKFAVTWDDRGNIGKRYASQDEIGTPFCITADFDTIEKDDKVTIRHRDTAQQERVSVDKLEEFLSSKLQ